MKAIINFNLNFTTSKVLSYLIFLGATAVAFYLKDKSVFIEGMIYATILQGVKAVSEIKSIKKAE